VGIGWLGGYAGIQQRCTDGEVVNRLQWRAGGRLRQADQLVQCVVKETADAGAAQAQRLSLAG